MQDILVTAQQLRNLEIPNVSTFIARRGTIGGLRSIVRGMLPGFFLAAPAGGGLVGGSAGALTGLVSMALFVGGTQAVSKMLADPVAFRSLREAIRPEVNQVQRRVNTLRVARALVTAGVEGGQYAYEEGEAIMDGLRDGILDLQARGYFLQGQRK